jgi:HK97 family phage portal protein
MKQSFLGRLFGRPAPEQAKSVFEGLSASPETLWTIRHGDFLGTYSEIYRKQPAVRTVVNFLSSQIASLNAKVYERVSDNDRRELDDHPLAVRLRAPNDESTRFRHMRDTVADLAVYDRAFWWKQFSGGEIVNLQRLSPAKVDVARLDGRSVYRLVESGRVIPREELVVFQGYSPTGDDLGVSPMETLRRVLAEERAAVLNREMMWRNAARQSTVLTRPPSPPAPEWSDEARERFRSDWEATMTGAPNSGRTAILEDGMTANTLSAFSPKEAEYVTGRKLTYEEVALAYGGAPLAALVVGQYSGSGSSLESFHTQLYQDVLPPWLRMLQDEIELQLLPNFDSVGGRRRIYIEFNLSEKLKGSFEEQASVLATSVGVPFMTVNDARSRLNMPIVDDDIFDVPVMPMNVMYGGQQSTQEPTADPSTPPGMLSRSKAVAPRSVIRRRDETAGEYERLFRDHFAHQERSIVSAVKAKADIPASRWESWDRTLSDLIFERSAQTTRRMGELAAAQIDGVYDPPRTLPYLVERSRIQAEGVNSVTREAVEAAADVDELVHVFDVAKSSRAEKLGVGTATALIGFARMEAAKHSQDADGKVRTKTWVVTSGNSRHPEMDGDTVPVGETFSNGALWPGDPSLGADQTAACRCLLLIN